MLFVWQASWKSGLTQEQMDGALMRRAGWSYPSGITVRGEFWLQHHAPAVISVFEVDQPGALMEMGFTWGDVFDITVTPAVTAEQGLQLGPEAMGRARRG